MKTLIKTLTVSIFPKITLNYLNNQLILKRRKPIPKLETRSMLK